MANLYRCLFFTFTFLIGEESRVGAWRIGGGREKDGGGRRNKGKLHNNADYFGMKKPRK